jgi:hypothetical protein
VMTVSFVICPNSRQGNKSMIVVMYFMLLI